MFLNLKKPTFSAKSAKKNLKENDAGNENASSNFQLTNSDNVRKKKDRKKKDKIARTSSDTDTVRNRLKLLILGRPSIETLQEKGIIKENVFGCPLNKLCAKENTTVPKFIQMCVEEVDRRGLDVDGIYRVSASLSCVMRLRYLIDRDEPVNLSDPQWTEVHILTGALKMFLRELPEPVLPYNSFNSFIAASKQSDFRRRVDDLKQCINSLPRVNADTLKYLIQHFRRFPVIRALQYHSAMLLLLCTHNIRLHQKHNGTVSSSSIRHLDSTSNRLEQQKSKSKNSYSPEKVVSHKSRNRMESQNIAIVFSQTLLAKPPDENRMMVPGGGEMAINMHYQTLLIETMIIDFDYIFV